MVFPTDGRAGQILAGQESSAQAALRERIQADQGDVIYGVAQGDIPAAARFCNMRAGGTVRTMNLTNTMAGDQVVVSLGTVTSLNYGWFQANGAMHGLVNQTVESANASTMLFIATDAAGDAGVAAFTTSGAAASTANSLNSAFLLALKVGVGNASTATSAILRAQGDVYGEPFRGT